MEAMIAKSPAQPWSSGIEEMKSDLAAVGESLSATLDLGALNETVQGMKGLSTSMGFIEYLAKITGGLKGEEYSRQKQLYDLQLEMIKSQLKIAKGAEQQQRIATYNMTVNANKGTDVSELARQVRTELQLMEARGV